MKLKLMILTLAMGVVSHAAVIACGGVSDVTTNLGVGSGNACAVNGQLGMLFSNFSVNASAGFTGSTVGIGALSTVIGNDVDLMFQIVNVPATAEIGDVILSYRVNGAINGVDMLFQATPTQPGGGVTVTEIVCTQAFTLGVCGGTTLANYAVTSLGQAASGQRSFDTQSVVWIQKDISYRDAAMSQFTNSQHMPSVPEPASLSLMGIGFLILGSVRLRSKLRSR